MTIKGLEGKAETVSVIKVSVVAKDVQNSPTKERLT